MTIAKTSQLVLMLCNLSPSHSQQEETLWTAVKILPKMASVSQIEIEIEINKHPEL